MHLTVWHILWNISVFIYLVESAPGGKPRNKVIDGHRRVRNFEIDSKTQLHAIEGARLTKVFCYDKRNTRNPKKVTWYRDGKELDLTNATAEGYLILNNSMSIAHIRSSENNVTYACRMTFSNGVVWRNTTLTIVSELDFQTNHTAQSWEFNDTDIDHTDRNKRIAPYFLMANTNLRETLLNKKIILPIGTSLFLPCPARGTPKPNIFWIKDDEQIENYNNFSSSFLRDHAVESDSGIYRCTARNSLGNATVTYDVEFSHNSADIPKIESDYPKNRTVYLGEEAVMECKQHSGTHPTIMWFKYVDENNNNRIRHDERYNLTDPAILIIKNASFSDQGMYLCIVSNSYGEAGKTATLTVVDYLPPVVIPHPEPVISLPYMVVICLMTLLFSGAIVYFLIHRFACGRQKKSSSSPLPTLTYRRHVKLYRMTPSTSEQSEEFLLPRLVKAEENWLPTNSGSIITSQATTISYCHSMLEYELPFDEEWEIPRENLNFQSEKLLGEGAFGKVVKAYRQSEGNNEVQPVAVKMSKDTANEDEFLIFAQELEVMKNIGKHPSVIQFIGCCTLGGPLYMVMEYASYGNLRDFLKKQQPLADYELPMGMQQLTRRELELYCHQIACGMKYLHSRKFIHRDLAARNILVVSHTSVKISDFGLSRDTFDSDYYRKVTNGKLPVKWMAPESLAESKFTQQSDVWSFGILMWEIMSFGDLPYVGLNDPERLISFLQANRLKRPSHSSDEMYALMLHCWQWMPSDRPNFKQITNTLDQLLNLNYLDFSSTDKMLMQENQEYMMGPFNTSV